MKDNRVELNELKNDIVRCLIPYKDIDGNDKLIEVYNIIGDRRYQILAELEKIVNVEEGEEEYALDEYYKELIMEFTDIKVDETNINEMLINPTLEFQILRKELDDMIYELQYEFVCSQIRNNRALMIAELTKQSIKEFETVERFVTRSEEMVENITKKKDEEKKEDVKVPSDNVDWFSYHIQAMVEELGEVMKADKRWKAHRNDRYMPKEKLDELFK